MKGIFSRRKSLLEQFSLRLHALLSRYVLCSANSQKRLAVQKNSRTICYAILCVTLIVAVPVIFRYEIVTTTIVNDTITLSEPTITLSKFGGSRFFRTYSMVIDFVRAIIPSLILCYINTRIVYLLCRMKSLAGTVFYRLTISLIIIIGCFICCYFPDALLTLILNVGYIDETYRRRAIREVTDFFVTFNSAVNFLVYFSISYAFRRSVLRLLERKRKSYCPTTYADLIHRQRQKVEFMNSLVNTV